jgi:hypothetical protein
MSRNTLRKVQALLGHSIKAPGGLFDRHPGPQRDDASFFSDQREV